MSATACEQWVVVAQFIAQDSSRSFLIDDVDALMGRLSEWNPVGLWYPDRYVLQVTIPDQSPWVALRCALAGHLAALTAAALPPSVLVRVEVCTVEAMELSWESSDPADEATLPARAALVCPELYTATRSLVAATTQAELSDIVLAFVTTTGGRVEAGPAPHCPGTIDIDLGIEGDKEQHAAADAVSVAGLIIEEYLPTLLIDAHGARARLQEHHPGRPRGAC